MELSTLDNLQERIEAFISDDLLDYPVEALEIAPVAIRCLEKLETFYRAFKSSDLSYLSRNFKQRFAKDLELAITLKTRVRNLSVNSYADPSRTTINTDAEALLAGVIERFGSALAFEVLSIDPMARHDAIMNESLNEIEEIKASITENAAEADRTLGVIRKAAGEVGVTQHGIIFKGEADAQAKAARNWLKAAAAAASLLVMLAIIWYLMIESGAHVPNDPYQFTVFMANKVLLVGIFIYIFTSAVKNYHNHKHNELVNQHRHNALLTYRAILEGSTSESTKDIVLAHAAACIFSPQDTGFSGNKDDSTGPKAVLELLANPTSRKD